MSDSKDIGTGQCPVCSGHAARFSLSKKGLVVVTCMECKMQCFSRGDDSDTRLRALIQARAPDKAAPEDQPAPEAAPAPAAPARVAGWGMLRGRAL